MSAVEVEMAAPLGAPVYVQPLRRSVRGRIVVAELREASGDLMRQYPTALPGQVVGVEADGTVYVRDRLHEPSFGSLRERLKERGLAPGPEREALGKHDRATMLFWLRRLVNERLAEVIQGDLPAKVEGPVQTLFVTQQAPDPATTAIDRLTEAFKALAAQLAAGRGRGGER